MKRHFVLPPLALAIILMISGPMDVQAQQKPSFVAQVDVTSEVVTFKTDKGSYVDFTMTVAGPDDFRLEQSFSGRETPSLRIKTEKGLTLPDGSYTIEVRARPKITDKQRAALAKVRQKGDRSEMRKMMKEIGLETISKPLSCHSERAKRAET